MSTGDMVRLAGLGAATVYEAAGRTGLIDIPLLQIVPGSRAAGPARTVTCSQDDNLMVHAVVEQVQPGDVVVISMPEPRPVALLGELLATQLQVRGAAGVLVDAAVRDLAELAGLGLPIWARYIRVKGADKRSPGALNVPVTLGGTAIAPGDIVVLDADGAVCVARARLAGVLAAAEARVARETELRARLLAGQTSYDLHGLRAVAELKRGNQP